ncbi:hypothetical protein PVK06_002682 [Gossypium arboreum]|uniref:Uncharacterized protein n=1 Tax=Gossypium arboreum TaxID=29729 RepID=A0ABR0R5C7_GOSAR|nr:hypothetical protein PVK06_002682 [Gossypium arboreum]
MRVCGYTPFARSFKAFSAKTIHLALNLGVNIKVTTSYESAIRKETVDDTTDVANGFDGADTGFRKWVRRL